MLSQPRSSAVAYQRTQLVPVSTAFPSAVPGRVANGTKCCHVSVICNADRLPVTRLAQLPVRLFSQASAVHSVNTIMTGHLADVSAPSATFTVPWSEKNFQPGLLIP